MDLTAFEGSGGEQETKSPSFLEAILTPDVDEEPPMEDEIKLKPGYSPRLCEYFVNAILLAIGLAILIVMVLAASQAWESMSVTSDVFS